MIEFIKGTLMLSGASLMLLASLGLLRMPDLLTRMHATTKASALGIILIMFTVAIHFAEVAMVARAVAIIVFVVMTAPIAAHVIGRAGYFVGAKLWSGTVKDELKPNYDPFTHELKSGMETQANAERRPQQHEPD